MTPGKRGPLGFGFIGNSADDSRVASALEHDLQFFINSVTPMVSLFDEAIEYLQRAPGVEGYPRNLASNALVGIAQRNPEMAEKIGRAFRDAEQWERSGREYERSASTLMLSREYYARSLRFAQEELNKLQRAQGQG